MHDSCSAFRPCQRWHSTKSLMILYSKMLSLFRLHQAIVILQGCQRTCLLSRSFKKFELQESISDSVGEVDTLCLLCFSILHPSCHNCVLLLRIVWELPIQCPKYDLSPRLVFSTFAFSLSLWVASGILKGFDPLLNLVLDGTMEYMRGMYKITMSKGLEVGMVEKKDDST